MKTKIGLIDSLKIEYKEIFEKREKLNKYLHSDHASKCYNSYSLLIAQLYAMDTYIEILHLRFLELDVSWSEFNEN